MFSIPSVVDKGKKRESEERRAECEEHHTSRGRETLSRIVLTSKQHNTRPTLSNNTKREKGRDETGGHSLFSLNSPHHHHHNTITPPPQSSSTPTSTPHTHPGELEKKLYREID
jgi:hypothetical protein